MVDTAIGQELLCVLNAYQVYHQIPLAEQDRDKVSFVTLDGKFFFVVMQFGLKNAEVTYQRITDKVCKDQISRNVKVYVDGILIKARAE